VLMVNSGVRNNPVVNMEFSNVSGEMSNSSTCEDEAVNDHICETSNADSAAEDVVLQLTVEDDPDPVYNDCSDVSPVTIDSVITRPNMCLTGCSRNMPSSAVDKNSPARIVLPRTVSDVAVAQAKVFRQYLLDGDIEGQILALDTCSGPRVCVQYV